MKANPTFTGERGTKTGLMILFTFAFIGIGIAGVVIFVGGFDITVSQDDAKITNNPITNTQTSINTPTKTGVRKSTPTPAPTSIPTVNPTLTPTLTPTPSPTPTRTATATPSPVNNDRYDEFMATLTGEAEVDAEIPIRLRGWTVVQGEVLIIAMNLTAESEEDVLRAREINTLVTSGFAQAVFHHDSGNIGGKIPKYLRIAEVNNTDSRPKTLYMNTSLAREYYSSQINAVEFSEKYWETERNMTAGEEQFISSLDKHAGNVTLYNESAK